MTVIEGLEDRRMLTLIPLDFTPKIQLSRTGTLTVTGTKASETIVVQTHREKLIVRVQVKGQRWDSYYRQFHPNAVDRLRINGANGADVIQVDVAVPGDSQIHGGRGNDTLITRQGGMSLFGDAGDDLLISDPHVNRDNAVAMTNVPFTQYAINQTRNQLFGGPGADILRSRGGDDSISGGTGSDQFHPLNALEQSNEPLPAYVHMSDIQYAGSRVRILDVEPPTSAAVLDNREIKVRYSSIENFSNSIIGRPFG